MANEGSSVTVTVSLTPGGITREGFSEPMILSNTGNAWGSPELTRTYLPPILASVAVDFPSTTPEYQAAANLLAQPFKVASLVIGKGPTKPTQTKTIAISSVAATATYKINAYALGVLQQATYTPVLSAAWTTITAYATGYLLTADTGKLYICITAGTSSVASPPTGTGSDITDGTVHWMYAGVGASGVTTNDAIVYNLAKALNALAAPDIAATSALTGSVGSKIITTTADAAGNWFALEPLATGDEASVSNLMALTDTTADPGVATDLDAVLDADSTWYWLVLLFKSAAIVATPTTGVAAWAEANERLLLASFSDTASATHTYSGGTDALHTLTAAGYSYTGNMWHPRDYEWFDAAKVGYFAPLAPGSYNATAKTYTGVTPVTFTGSQLTNLGARRSALYFVEGGVNTDGGLGQVNSTTYLFIDNRVNIDWYRTNLQADLVDLKLQSLKIANTNAGRAKIRVAIQSRNDTGISVGVISPDPLDSANGINQPYTVYVPPVSVASSFNATTRALTGITTAWKLAGAIDSMAVLVNVTQ